jgi:hypothetical protein
MQSINTADMAAEAEKHGKELQQMREQLTEMDTRLEEIIDFWKTYRGVRTADLLRDQLVSNGTPRGHADELTGSLRNWIMSMLEDMDVQRRIVSASTDIKHAARTSGSIAHVAARIARLTKG